jgi:adenine specific DNA methylase Mod
MVELIWDGKYKGGKKQGPVRIALPFQTVETVNESTQERQRSLEMFSAGRDTEWRNRLIWGDKKYVLPSLLSEFAGKVNLIYIDPPFNTGGDFSFRTSIPDSLEGTERDSASFVKEPSVIEQKAYRDTWGVSPEDRGRGVSQVDRYSRWLYETCVVLYELLANDGTIYIHLDWNVGHYAKVVADEVFDAEAFRNEIIWYYTNKLGTGGNTFDKHHDNLYVYVKGDVWTHNPLLRPVKEQKLQPVTKKIEGERVWLRDDEGKRRYEMGRPETKVGDVWEVPYINPMAEERLGYDTQKPEKLLENVIRA